MSKTINDLFSQAQRLSETLIDLNPLLQTPAAQTLTSHIKEMTQRELSFAQEQVARAQERLEEVKGELSAHQDAAKEIFESGVNAHRDLLTDMGRRALQVAEESMSHMSERSQAQIELAKSLAQLPSELTQRAQGTVKEAAWGALSAVLGISPAPRAEEEASEPSAPEASAAGEEGEAGASS